MPKNAGKLHRPGQAAAKEDSFLNRGHCHFVGNLCCRRFLLSERQKNDKLHKKARIFTFLNRVMASGNPIYQQSTRRNFSTKCSSSIQHVQGFAIMDFSCCHFCHEIEINPHIIYLHDKKMFTSSMPALDTPQWTENIFKSEICIHSLLKLGQMFLHF